MVLLGQFFVKSLKPMGALYHDIFLYKIHTKSYMRATMILAQFLNIKTERVHFLFPTSQYI